MPQRNSALVAEATQVKQQRVQNKSAVLHVSQCRLLEPVLLLVVGDTGRQASGSSMPGSNPAGKLAFNARQHLSIGCLCSPQFTQCSDPQVLRLLSAFETNLYWAESATLT